MKTPPFQEAVKTQMMKKKLFRVIWIDILIAKAIHILLEYILYNINKTQTFETNQELF